MILGELGGVGGGGGVKTAKIRVRENPVQHGHRYGIDFAADKKAQGFLDPIFMGTNVCENTTFFGRDIYQVK